MSPPSPSPKKKKLFHDKQHSADFTELTAVATSVDANGVRKTPPSGVRRHSFGRNSSGSNVPYRRHDSLSTIDEESTPPSSTTPPGQAIVVAPVHVVVHTGPGGTPTSMVTPRGKKCRSWTVSSGSSPHNSPGMTVKAKTNVQIKLHRSLPGTPTGPPREDMMENNCDNLSS